MMSVGTWYRGGFWTACGGEEEEVRFVFKGVGVEIKGKGLIDGGAGAGWSDVVVVERAGHGVSEST